ncbi:MAG: ATP-dependent DNA helicase [Gammaproteobacteria bacterium]|nr:ATP-dependent DNA helicase [Gammaproteobacteria bacterium]
MSAAMDSWFATGGELERCIEGFRAREQQRVLAGAVAAAIDESQVLVAEAGTGVGKTFAYLVPALLSGKQVIISTGTRHLQDQLYHRDLPAVQAATGRPVDVALLKGRANYLCLHRLDIAREEASVSSRRDMSQLERVARFGNETGSGDLAELVELAEDSPLRPRITSTSENCLGSECPLYNDCFVVKARRRAQEADVVVVNHHLLLADMVLKEEGFGELLPGADAVIIDEAHQLPELASNYFGSAVSSRQLVGLARDTLAEALKVASDTNQLGDRARQLEFRASDLKLRLGEDIGRFSWREGRSRQGVEAALEALQTALAEFREVTATLAAESRGLENCHERAELAQARLDQLDAADAPGMIRWAELTRRHFILHATPVDPAEQLQQQVYARPTAWIFTSATLSVGRNVKHFIERMGLDEPRVELLDSPFDYANNALLFVPQGLPAPSDPGFTRAVARQALPLIRASRGRAFVLFTSHRALREAAGLLQDHIDYPLLVQGDMPKAHLLERFRQAGDAVLLGTGSFWEGVDVRGAALSLVIIDKLPFAMPGDPVLQARLDAVRARGGNPFMDYQVPQAVIGLKQGFGRLIRDVTDTGVMVICDNRLYGKSYGKVFLDSLPDISITRDASTTLRFLNELS